MSPIDNGFSTFIPRVCCGGPFVPTMSFARSACFGVIVKTPVTWLPRSSAHAKDALRDTSHDQMQLQKPPLQERVAVR